MTASYFGAVEFRVQQCSLSRFDSALQRYLVIRIVFLQVLFMIYKGSVHCIPSGIDKAAKFGYLNPG